MEGSSVMKSRALIVCQFRVPRGRARVERTLRPTVDRVSSGSRSDVPDSSRCSGAVAALRPYKTRREMTTQLDTKGRPDQVVEREGTPSRTERGGKLQSGPFLRPIESCHSQLSTSTCVWSSRESWPQGGRKRKERSNWRICDRRREGGRGPSETRTGGGWPGGGREKGRRWRRALQDRMRGCEFLPVDEAMDGGGGG